MFIVRYSEIGLKGKRARERMESLLVRNIKQALSSHGVTAEVKKGQGRIYVSEESDSSRSAVALSRVMGIKTFSHCEVSRIDSLDDVVNKSVQLWAGLVSGKKFAVRARRTGQHDFRSSDIMQRVGDALYKKSSGVDLARPEVEVSIEVRDRTGYFFSETLPGPGGLPLGSEGKLVALVSGGIDSPVAAWSVMKRGSPTDIVFCSLAPPTDLRDFLTAANKLVSNWSFGYDPKIHILDGRMLVETITDPEKYKMGSITYKRILYLAAQKIAERSGAHGIVTGESLGQVSSQTPESLHATSHNMNLPVMRPLLGLDKDEISYLARKIGTFPETSSGEFCAIFAGNPITRPTVEELEKDMSNFTQLEGLLSTDHTIRGSSIQEELEKLPSTDLILPGVPENSIIVDMRAREKFSQWHMPGALNISIRNLDKFLDNHPASGKPYVFYCSKGLQSAYAASRAREKGKDAYYTDEIKIRKMLQA